MFHDYIVNVIIEAKIMSIVGICFGENLTKKCLIVQDTPDLAEKVQFSIVFKTLIMVYYVQNTSGMS